MLDRSGPVDLAGLQRFAVIASVGCMALAEALQEVNATAITVMDKQRMKRGDAWLKLFI
jgi:hypothetical protein